jgi:hypothetical protein
MSKDRTKISTLLNRRISLIEEDDIKPQFLNFRSIKGRVIFSVDKDQIFDRSGNRFEIDL